MSTMINENGNLDEHKDESKINEEKQENSFGLEDDNEQMNSIETNRRFQCHFCQEFYIQPKFLLCTHSFCYRCIEKLIDENLSKKDLIFIRCPLCQDMTEISNLNELVDDYLLINEIEEYQINQGTLECRACKSNDRAVAHCSTCLDYLCMKCCQAHQYMKCFEQHHVRYLKQDEQEQKILSVENEDENKFQQIRSKFQEKVDQIDQQRSNALAHLDFHLTSLQQYYDQIKNQIDIYHQQYQQILYEIHNEFLSSIIEYQCKEEMYLIDQLEKIQKASQAFDDIQSISRRYLEKSLDQQFVLLKEKLFDRKFQYLENLFHSSINSIQNNHLIQSETYSKEDLRKSLRSNYEQIIQFSKNSQMNFTAINKDSKENTEQSSLISSSMINEDSISLSTSGIASLPIIPTQLNNTTIQTEMEENVLSPNRTKLTAAPTNITELSSSSSSSLSSSSSSSSSASSSLSTNEIKISNNQSQTNLTRTSVENDFFLNSTNSIEPVVENLRALESIFTDQLSHVHPNVQRNLEEILQMNQQNDHHHQQQQQQQSALLTRQISAPPLGQRASPSLLSNLSSFIPTTSLLTNYSSTNSGGSSNGNNSRSTTPFSSGTVNCPIEVNFNNLSQSSSSSLPRRNGQTMQVRSKFGSLGPQKCQFNAPHGFCLGTDEEIIVADTNNHRIQIFDKIGEYKYQFGIPGKDEGQLWYPRKVAVIRPNGKFVVCDRGNERSRMQIFTRNGHFIKKISIRYIDIVAGLAITNEGNIVAVDSVSPTVFCISESGDLLKWFDCSDYMREPSDIAIFNNEYFVCDFKGHCVAVFDEDGNYLRRIGSETITNFPNGIDISDAGDVIIGDSHGNRFHIAVYSREGDFLQEFDCPYVKVSRCCGLKITSDGFIVTLAKNNHHVLVLNTLYLP